MKNTMIENYESIDSLEHDKPKTSDEVASSLSSEFITGIRNDNKLREKYAKYLIWILAIQLLIINVIFVLVGLKILEYSQFTINLYVSACILEITALVTIIVKYLFSNSKNNVDNIVRDYINKENHDKYAQYNG